MTERIGVLSDYQNVALQSADWSAVAARAEIALFHDPIEGVENAAQRLADFTIICVMRERVPISAELLERLPNLKCIVTTANLNRAIDLDAARRRGVVVSGTGNGDGSRATAELAWGLLIAAARGIVREERAVREDAWQVGLGTLLHGKTLGLIGLGIIGEMMAHYARAFGMNVIAWSENLTAARSADCGATCVSKAELFRQSDAVSVHIVLSDRTRGLIGAAELGAMKPGAIIVNTSRGAIIDQEALIAAVAQGRIGTVALDAFEVEPLPVDHPLRGWPDRILLSPHVGYVTEEVYRVFYRETVESVLAFLNGKPIRCLT